LTEYAVISFSTHSIYELHFRTDQRQQVTAIEAPPTLLGHVEQLERHQQTFGSRARACSGSGFISYGRAA
jgi:hypothetical protein